jgi:hypothetical protein
MRISLGFHWVTILYGWVVWWMDWIWGRIGKEEERMCVCECGRRRYPIGLGIILTN